MRKTTLALAMMTALALSACGGSSTSPRAGDQTPATKFSSQISFGDSLSDVGSYNVGAVAALKGGKFTINGDNTSVNPELTGKNWTEYVAAQLGLAAPCSAQTGLEGDASKGFAVPVTLKANCFNYAQGGSRVTNPVGPNNKLLNPTLGLTTVPVVTQVANHLAKAGGKFAGTELVTVMAGGNDILFLLGDLSAKATAAGTAAGAKAFATSLVTQLATGATNPATAAQTIGLAVQTEAARSGSTPQTIVQAGVVAAIQAGFSGAAAQATAIAAKAQTDATAAGAKAGADYAVANGPAIVQAMSTAGTELANLVKTQIVAKGAGYVLVNNLPDVASTPSGKSQSADTQTLIKTAVDAFNTQLKNGVASEAKVLYVDLWSISHDQVTNPGPYGLTNTSTPACGTNALGTSSLVCNASNVIAGDVSHYMFADEVHPTPFENALVARYVLLQMSGKGWL
jgi:phospholipase/lecithinase/hemolysin